MLTTLAVTLCVAGYLHIGYHLGDIGVKTWLAKDNDSLRSFLLFPVSHHKKRIGELGENALAPCGDCDLNKKDSPRSSGYKAFMMFIWPGKILVNIPAIMLYGGIDGVSSAVRAFHASRAKALEAQRKREENLMPSTGDDVHALFAKRQEAVSRIQVLVERKKAIDEELERRRLEMDAAFELEAAADPEIRQLLAPSKDAN